MTRRQREDPAACLLAARCLATTPNAAWAYRCYRRAARLRPGDLALAEEVGLFGARRLHRQYSRSWPVYLVTARADPERRARVDPHLLRLAGRLPAELSVLVTVASVFAVIVGAYTVRKGHPLQRTLPPDHVALPPFVGPIAALGILAVFAGLVWLAFRPVRRFGTDILRHTLRRPRVVHVLAMLGALVCVAGSLVVAWFGATPEFESYALWLLPAWGISIVLAFAGLPLRDTLAVAVGVAADAVIDETKK